jgi:predicted dehydrogenase
MMREIGVGLISVGWMGQVHTKAYKAVPVVYPSLGIKTRLVIAADTSQDRVDYATNVLGYEIGTLDYKEVLAHPDVEVVSICSPNFLHAEIGIAAAKAGKAFWIEKPVGRGATETESVQEQALKNNVTTSIGFNYRHAPAVEYAKTLIADGGIGEITNVRGTFLADYSADPKGALSWRFIRSLAGSGVLGDLMGHLVDLMHYVVGPISEVVALSKTVYTERPELPMGSGTHFTVIENGVMKSVENEDIGIMLLKFTSTPLAKNAIGTLEVSRVAVGPRAALGFEIYGTKGSLKWDFERMNELEVAIGRDQTHAGYTRVLAHAEFGDFAAFHPGAGNGMGYDDLKIIEAKKFLSSFIGNAGGNSNINDALASARVTDAAEKSVDTGSWQVIEHPTGTTAAKKP